MDYSEAVARRIQAMDLLTSQNTHEWYTPPHVVGWVRSILGSIELDPASCAKANETVRAAMFFDHEQNGLLQPWVADTLYLNPPFDATRPWIDKLSAEVSAGNVREAILLVNSAPGYRWFEKLWRERPVCLLEDRIRFVREDGTVNGQAKKGQTLAYFGPNFWKFRATLETHGRVLLP